MADRQYVTNIGSMDEDEMWGAFTDWNDLEALFRSPQAWVADRPKLPALAEGVITIVVTYQLNDQLPPLAIVEDEEADPTAIRPIFVMSGNSASVVQVRILRMPPSGAFPLDFTLWMPPNGATLHLDGSSQPLPGGSVIEFQDGSMITIPAAQPLTISLVPSAAIGYLHFPLLSSQGAQFFSLAVQDPQGYIKALREHMASGMTVVKREPAADPALLPQVALEDLVDPEHPKDTRQLEGLRMIYQSGPISPCSDICGKTSGVLSPTDAIAQNYTLRIDTILAYAY